MHVPSIAGASILCGIAACVGACDPARPAGAGEPPAPPAATAEELAAARASYDRYRRPDLLVAALGLRPGDVIADVGAGTGYLEPRLAAAVGPTGRVVATDIDPAALAELRRRAADAPIETRLVAADDPGLEAGAYDLILLVQVDHLLGDRAAYLRRLAPALAPRGRVAVSNRLTYRAKALAAASEAGLSLVSETGDLPGQFLLVFDHEVTQ